MPLAFHLNSAKVWLLRPDEPVRDAELETLLHAEDHEYLRLCASESRRSEYRRSRWLIRSLLGADAELRKTSGGSLTWPPGILASLSHKQGIIAFAALDEGSSGGFSSLGIDLERVHPRLQAIREAVFNPAELRLLARLAESGTSEEGPYDRLLTLGFSFKESVYKCLNPLCGVYFSFHDFEISEWDLSSSTIHGKLSRKLNEAFPQGFMMQASYVDLALPEAYVLTAVTCQR